MFKLGIAMILILAAATALPTGPVLANQLVDGVTNSIHRLDPRIQVPPLTPIQAAQLKGILDDASRGTTQYQKKQSVRQYLSTIESQP